MSKRTADAELPDAPGSGGGAPDGSLFARYPIDPRFYDEMFEAGGAPRDHCHELWNVLDGMAPEDIAAIQEHAERSFLQEGITFAVYGEAGAQERIIPIDVLPRIVDADTWEFIERGLRQRLKALNLFLADIYGLGRILSDGVVPVDMLYGCPQYRIERRGVEVPQGIHVALCGIDLVRTHDGFMVLEDNLRVPSGVSYMLANRGAVKSSLNNLFRQYRVRGIEHYGSLLRQTLSELAPPGVSDPCIVLLTPGVHNSAFYEHMFLAREMGVELVQGMEHILETGRGVCQDYTHVLLAIGRSWGIPSRYVSGYLHREGAAGEQSLAGASHSWGEFFLPELGWVGIDPTNDTVADHRFIAVAVGRDYADACPTRGTVLGGGESTLDVKVTVVSEDETAPDWSPHREWPNLRTVTPTPREYSGGFDQCLDNIGITGG